MPVDKNTKKALLAEVRGEVEVDESNLSDFLKFADTLQVKGLSQGEGTPAWTVAAAPDPHPRSAR